MRPDMDKVVTERPRYGHANRSKKTGFRVRRYEEGQFDDLPQRLASSRRRQYGWDGKDFSDRIGPLRRFLQSRVGYHWNKVYGELSQVLSKRNLTGQHIWQHVWLEVELHCVIGDDGKVYSKNSSFGRRFSIYKKLYVHPKTGILCQVQKKRRTFAARSGPSENSSAFLIFKKIDNL